MQTCGVKDAARGKECSTRVHVPREIGTKRIVSSCQQAAYRVVMLGCLPLDDMKARLRLDDLGHFAWLQRKRRLLELGLHVTLSEESPSDTVSKLCFIRDDAVCV